ncbi:DNA binding protein [Aspergillus wentii]|nr:DNA binding protein [Aspergillus wentii]
MVRIKFTGPPTSTVQIQPAPAVKGIVSNSPLFVRQKTRAEVKEVTQLVQLEKVSQKQQQSLEMVQIMLHVSFGTLFYLREFLPLPCFDDRDLKQAQRDQKCSYQEFVNGKAGPGKFRDSTDLGFGKGKKGQPLKVIVRNSDPKADMILNLLENGIFDALSKNVLEAVQLTILVDKDTPDHVVESYTFSFRYIKGTGDMGSRLESLSLDPVGRLITLSAFLPTLPNKRNLGIHLFYTDDCPPEYEPPGFAVAPSDTISVGLQVTSLKWTGPDPEGSEAPPKIPLQIEYNDEVQRTADIGSSDKGSSILNGLGSRNGSFLEATQDITERQKLQMMIPVKISTKIECAFCHTHQHMICYGFQGSDDSRLPHVHACYQCLLEPNESHLLSEMNTLVLLRRALKIILDEGFPEKTSLFTQKLHCNGQTVIQITDLLRKYNFLQPTSGYKSKGFLQKGLPKYSIPRSERIRRRLEQEILDPMTKIGHHYVKQGAEGSSNGLGAAPNQEFDLVDKTYSQVGDRSVDGRDHNEQETQNTDDKQDKPLQETNPNDSMASSQDTSSTNVEMANGGLRRSSRKRRKISNYLRLIDVGAMTSGDENS